MSLAIAGRQIGPGHPVFIVAELSGNHNRSYDNAARLVHAAKQAGADAVKFQCYTADTMTIASPGEAFKIEWQGQTRTLYGLYKEASTPWWWIPKLAKLAESLGLIWFSSVFDASSVDFLEGIGCPAYKIASFELTDLPLIRYAAGKGKPMILSTGMATPDEIVEAVVALCKCAFALLHCVSAYPARPEDANLRKMATLDYRGLGLVGLSDHTLSLMVPVAAVALGACVVEKHLCLDRTLGGPDASFSLEPQEFAAMVEAVRIAEQALGKVQYGPTASENPMLRFRRSIVSVADIARGEALTAENVRVIRPANGLHPRHYEAVLGRRAARDIERGEPLTWEMLEGNV